MIETTFTTPEISMPTLEYRKDGNCIMDVANQYPYYHESPTVCESFFANLEDGKFVRVDAQHIIDVTQIAFVRKGCCDNKLFVWVAYKPFFGYSHGTYLEGDLAESIIVAAKKHGNQVELCYYKD